MIDPLDATPAGQLVFHAKRGWLAFGRDEVLLSADEAGIRSPIEGLIEWVDIGLVGVRTDPPTLGFRILGDGSAGDRQPTDSTIWAWQTRRFETGYDIVIDLRDAADDVGVIADRLADYAFALGQDLHVVDFDTFDPMVPEDQVPDAWPRLPQSNLGTSDLLDD